MHKEAVLRTTLAIGLGTFSVLALGCMGSLDSSQGGEAIAIDEVTILDQVAHYRDTTSFDHVSGKAYASALGATTFIELYTSRTASMQYAAIAPEVSGSNAVVPEGGVIVREVLDESGVAQRLTVMAKGPAGYNLNLGDWYFAVTDLNGVPIMQDGVARSGKLADCYGCHQPRVTDDYLFGVPLIDRSTSGSTTPTTPQGTGGVVCGDFICEKPETHDTCAKDCKRLH